MSSDGCLPLAVSLAGAAGMWQLSELTLETWSAAALHISSCCFPCPVLEHLSPRVLVLPSILPRPTCFLAHGGVAKRLRASTWFALSEVHCGKAAGVALGAGWR